MKTAKTKFHFSLPILDAPAAKQAFHCGLFVPLPQYHLVSLAWFAV
jgi:hypothetical protein